MPDSPNSSPTRPLPWSESERLVPRSVVRPLRRFADTEAASGLVMLLMAIVAIIWANSAWGDDYIRWWNASVLVEFGSWLHLDLSVREWINDLLMGFFFFVVAMEIKRELVRGELADLRAAAMPVIAAVGGMVVPALIYAAFNAGGPGSPGWGIPMATDIAFAVGVVSLLGRRIPSSLVVFLLSFAIVDDLGAITVIAVFYTEGLAPEWLLVAVAMVAVAYAIRRHDVRSLVPYVVLAAACWLALHESGVHTTLAGVAFGLITPSRSFFDRSAFPEMAEQIISRVVAADVDHDRHAVNPAEDDEAEEAEALDDLILLANEVQAPLDRLERRFVPWTAFLVVPLFALANAGVQTSWSQLVEAFSEPVTLGVFFGLVLGKPLGIFLFAWVAVRLKVGKMPVGATWRQVWGVAMLGGIGFTVALFVTELAFGPGPIGDQAKVGILAASAVAGICGYLFLRLVSPKPPVEAAR